MKENMEGFYFRKYSEKENSLAFRQGRGYVIYMEEETADDRSDEK